MLNNNADDIAYLLDRASQYLLVIYFLDMGDDLQAKQLNAKMQLLHFGCQ
jgi:arginyl-tRNA synthetase